MSDIYETPSAQLREVDASRKPGNPIIAVILGVICFLVLERIATIVAIAVVFFRISIDPTYVLALVADALISFAGCYVSAIWSRQRLMPLATGACIIAIGAAYNFFDVGSVTKVGYLFFTLLALSSVVTCLVFCSIKFKHDWGKATG